MRLFCRRGSRGQSLFRSRSKLTKPNLSESEFPGNAKLTLRRWQFEIFEESIPPCRNGGLIFSRDS
jgi:hypothetical protein